jgi:hypothetical protein
MGPSGTLVEVVISQEIRTRTVFLVIQADLNRAEKEDEGNRNGN